MKEWLVKYVPHDEVPAHEAEGWRVDADLSHHSAHSVLMRRESAAPEAA